MKEIEKLKPFTRFLMTIGELPSSYLVSMTYEEQLLWFCNYLEKTVIPTVNNNAEAVIELQNFITNYFDNLDVQEEINNKLDEMATDGTLTNLIKDYVDPIYEAYEEEINNEITDLSTEISTFKNSVNDTIEGFGNTLESIYNYSPIPVSSTDDMIDETKIYVNTTDGKWYYYDGEAWTIGGTYQASSNQEQVDDINNVMGFGIYKKTLTNNTGLYFTYNLENSEVSSGDTLFIKISEVTGGVVDRVEIYGVRSDNTTTLLATIRDFKKAINVNITEAFTKIRVVPQYSSIVGTTKTGVFIVGTSVNSLTNEIAEIEKNLTSLNNTQDSFENGMGYNYFSFTATNNSAAYYSYNIPNSSVENGDIVYSKMIEATGGIVSNAELYGIRSDNSYQLLTTMSDFKKTVNANITESYDHLRIVINYSSVVGTTKTGKFLVGTEVNSLTNEIAEIENKIDLTNTLNNTTSKIFRKVVCCGDSYTSGYIVDGDNVAHEVNEDYAFPHYMETMTGNEWINCGVSGANAKTWLSAERGLTKAQNEGKAQAYIVGIMINDRSGGANHLDLGTVDDIGTNAQTYYGCYSKIVRELNDISPNAKIFIETCPNSHSSYTDYNQAVRDIYDAYKNTYPVYLLDLYEHIDLYSNASLTNDQKGGHYTAIGYEQFAEILNYILSDYINTHITDFQDVAFIEID